MDNSENTRYFNRNYTTYFSATGKAGDEITWSNLLAFFLEPKDGYDLWTLVLDAFLCAGNEKKWCGNPTWKNLQIGREVRTRAKKRLDIVVSWIDEDENKRHRAIAIENKVESDDKKTPDNPFEQYEEYLDNKYDDYRAFILSPNGTKAGDRSRFMAIKYSSLTFEIRQRLKDKIAKNGMGKWEYMLEDFVDTVDANLDPELRKKHNEQVDFLYGEILLPNDHWKRSLRTEKDKLCKIGSKMLEFEFKKDKKDKKESKESFYVGIYLEDDWVYKCFRKKEGEYEIPIELVEFLERRGYPGEGGKIESHSKTMKDSRKDVLNFLKKFLPDFEEAIEKSLKESV